MCLPLPEFPVLVTVIDSRYQHVRVKSEKHVTESKCKKALSSLVLCFIVFCESLSNQRVVFKVVQRQECFKVLGKKGGGVLSGAERLCVGGCPWM